jgi:putative protease
MADKPIGQVTHYYDKIGVAVVELQGSVSIGDKLKFVKGDEEFEQVVNSMQAEHQSITKAKKGDSIGLKVDQAVKKGTKVYQVA